MRSSGRPGRPARSASRIRRPRPPRPRRTQLVGPPGQGQVVGVITHAPVTEVQSEAHGATPTGRRRSPVPRHGLSRRRVRPGATPHRRPARRLGSCGVEHTPGRPKWAAGVDPGVGYRVLGHHGPSGGSSGGVSNAGSGSGSSGARRTDEDGRGHPVAGLPGRRRHAPGRHRRLRRRDGPQPDLSERAATNAPTATVRAGGPRHRATPPGRACSSQLDASLRRLGTDHIDLWQVPVGGGRRPVGGDPGRGRSRGGHPGGCATRAWSTTSAGGWPGPRPGSKPGPGRTPIVSDHGRVLAAVPGGGGRHRSRPRVELGRGPAGLRPARRRCAGRARAGRAARGSAPIGCPRRAARAGHHRGGRHRRRRVGHHRRSP